MLDASRDRTLCRVELPDLICLAALCLAVAVWAPAQAQTWTTYTDASGVSGLDVDGDEAWVGTDGGVLRWNLPLATYLKYTTTEGLADQLVRDVLVDAGGDLWFGTLEGVQHFDGATWTTYTTSNSQLPNNVVYSLAQDLDGDMWFGTGYGCAQFDGTSWQVFTDLGGGATNVAVRDIGVDSLNHIWTANNPYNYGDPGGVSRYDGSSWTRFDPDPTSIGQFFLALAVDDADHVWAGSWTNWAFTYDGAAWTHLTSSNSGLVGVQIEAIEVGTDGTVWIGNHASSYTAATNGVARYDGTWTSYTSANSGLPPSFVYAIAATADAAFIGTGSKGIVGFDGATWTPYTTANEPHCNWITDIVAGQVGTGSPALYFGTDYYGIAVFTGGIWSSLTTANSGLGDNYVNDVHVENGMLWVASRYSGLWEFDGTTWTSYDTGNSGLLGDIIVSVDTDSSGTLWLGTDGWAGPSGQNGALARYDGVTWTNYYLANSGLVDDDELQVAVAPDDTVWIGTDEGVSHFDGGSTWTSYTTADGLAENHVKAIAFDAANGIWFATLGGVSHLSGTGSWTSYSTASGLPSSDVRDITISTSGAIWAATANGAAVFDGGTWWSYNQAGGLADNDVTAVAIGPDGRVWFGTDRSGITVGSGTFPAQADVFVYNESDACFYLPGDTVTLTIVVGNSGPDALTDVGVTDLFPDELTGVAWSCVGSLGGACAGSGTGDIVEMVSLPVGASVTFTVTGGLDAGATGSLVNTAQAFPPVAIDLDPTNNVASHLDHLEVTLFCDSFETGTTSGWTTALP